MIFDALFWLLKLYVKGGIGMATVVLFLLEVLHDHPVIKLLERCLTT